MSLSLLLLLLLQLSAKQSEEKTAKSISQLEVNVKPVFVEEKKCFSFIHSSVHICTNPISATTGLARLRSTMRLLDYDGGSGDSALDFCCLRSRIRIPLEANVFSFFSIKIRQ